MAFCGLRNALSAIAGFRVLYGVGMIATLVLFEWKGFFSFSICLPECALTPVPPSKQDVSKELPVQS